MRQHGAVEKPRPHWQGGFSTARLRRSGRNDEGVAGAGGDDTADAERGTPISSFRPEPCGARRPPLVISTGAVRSAVPPPSSFRPEPCVSTAEWRNLVPVGQGGFSTARLRRSGRNDAEGARLRRSGRNDEGVAGAGSDDTADAERGTAISSFRPELCGARRPPLVISTGAVRQHGGVEKPRPHWQGGFSTARLRRSGRNDEGVAGAGGDDTADAERGGSISSFRPEPCAARRPPSSFRPEPCGARRSGETSSPWGREVSPLRAFGAPVEMTRRGRAFGASVEMTKGWLGRGATTPRMRSAAPPSRHFDRSCAERGGPRSSFRPELCGARRLHLVISTGAVRSAAAPARHFDRSCAERGTPTLVISTGAVRQHGGVEKPRPRGAGRFLHCAPSALRSK